MRFIKKQLSWWPIVLFVGGAAFAMPIANSVRLTAMAIVNERQVDLDPQATEHHEEDSRAAVGPGTVHNQDYYDRRREYWEKRVERRLDEEDIDDNDDAEDAKDSKAGKNDDDEDEVEQELGRRREFW